MNFVPLVLLVSMIAMAVGISAEQGLSQSQVRGDSPLSVSNNSGNSVYPSVAASEDNVYIVWEDDNFGQSVSYDTRNNDILFVRSADGGNSFGYVTNLSNNTSLSGRPNIAAYGKNVYVIWTEDTPNDRQIWFSRSIDNGTTFDRPVSLTTTKSITGATVPKAIAAYGNDIYVVWRELSDDGKSSRILLKVSTDGGSNFGETRVIYNNAVYSSSPKIAASGKNVYVVWDVIPDRNNKENIEGIFFVKSSDRANNFGNVSKISGTGDIGEAQVAAYLNEVYVAWAGSVYRPDQSTRDVFLTYSLDNGGTFSDIALINRGLTSSENIELALSENKIYSTWQDKVAGNGEIFHMSSLGNKTSFSTVAQNLSSNEGLSECPSVAIAGNITYAVWEDDTYGNHEILFTKLP